MTRYTVTYASAGCLPDTDEPTVFDTLKDAREYVADEWREIASACDEWWNHSPDHMSRYPSSAQLQAVASIYAMTDGSSADDPRPGSLYRWSIERALAVPE